MEFLLIYILVGAYIAGSLLHSAQEEPEFEELAFREVFIGFCLHMLAWPWTIWAVVHNKGD